MSIKVAVRVRPFNSREKERDAKLIISMTDVSTSIRDEMGQDKTFTFDCSFWSHDHFITEENGYLSPEPNGPYCDQKYVFNALGKEILDNAWEGYHCCLFAYGQTGSGKSYSMVGYGANKGIVPISCEEIFTRIANNKDESMKFEVEVSMLEIYNEKVQDLLADPTKRPPTGLKIRESKALGIFVEGLTKYPVQSYKEISDKMDEGYENRTIGSTQMNATSSRAHTIVTVEFKQVQTIGTTKSEKLSKINLVDLAGSERANSTGATGDRLKEGCNINKSLLVLGNVINTLADKALGKKKDVLPPYRDSALTRILQNALGGNSKTVMICALSPADINYEETLSTLRYADRAKKIQNKAVVNESEHDKTVRLLKEENNELKKMIEELSQKLLGNGGVVQEEDKQQFKNLKEQYDANEKMFENMQKSFSERVEEAKRNEKELGLVKIDITKPHLVVLNEDPQLSHKLKYSLTQLPIYVGRKHGNPTPQITLSGIGIKQNHAIFQQGSKEGEVVLKPKDKDAKEYIFINGKKMASEDGCVLKNKDKIIFGTNTIMVFFEHSDGKDLYEFDWEAAQVELQKEIEEQNEKKKEEALNVLKQSLEEKYIKDKQEIEKQLQEYEKKIKEMANQTEEKKRMEKEKSDMEALLRQRIETLEADKLKKKKEVELKKSEIVKNKEREFVHKSEKLENTLLNIVKKIYKLKIIISELKRNIDLDIFLTKNLIDHYNDPNTQINILIRVENFEEGTVYYWTSEVFHNRYDLMKELYNRYLDEEDFDIYSIPKEEDPLWDQQKQSLLGYAFYKLEPVAYLMSNFSNVSIISVNGDIMGTLAVDVIPHDNEGKEFEEIPEHPSDLIGQELKFKVYIKECRDLPENFSKNVQVEYTSFHDNMDYKTKVYNTDNKEPNIQIEEIFEHKIEYLTKDDIEFLEKYKICFKVYATEEVEIKEKGERPTREQILSSREKETTIDDSALESHSLRNSMPLERKRAQTMTGNNNQNNMRGGARFMQKITDKVDKVTQKVADKDCIIF